MWRSIVQRTVEVNLVVDCFAYLRAPALDTPISARYNFVYAVIEETMSNKSFNYGGQAVLEGVMMRGSKALAVAVRNPEGAIVTHVEPVNQTIYNGPISRIPFLRGLTMLWDALGLGLRSLMFSADIALGEEDEISFSGPVAWGTVALSLAFGIGLFFILPVLVVGLVDNWVQSSLVSNLLEGTIRLLLFIGYVWLIGKMPDIKRVFAYHGAEHKTINAYEAGDEVDLESVQLYTTVHPRCGTGFLLSVVVISILLFSLLGRPVWWLRILSRVALIPVVAGLAYEYIRFSARHMDNVLIRAITVPNLAMQRLTTREPDPTMLEVAVTAFNCMMTAETAPLDQLEAHTTGVTAP
jgi:uncharacterized protein YqhQ